LSRRHRGLRFGLGSNSGGMALQLRHPPRRLLTYLCPQNACGAAMKTCSIESCDREHYARGWCLNHYLRWWRHGDPLAGKDREPWKHGTSGGYSNHHCRCDLCRAAWAVACKKTKQGTCGSCGGTLFNKYVSTLCRNCWEEKRPRWRHGTESGYNAGCKCSECRKAANAARNRRRKMAVKQ